MSAHHVIHILPNRLNRRRNILFLIIPTLIFGVIFIYLFTQMFRIKANNTHDKGEAVLGEEDVIDLDK